MKIVGTKFWKKTDQ